MIGIGYITLKLANSAICTPTTSNDVLKTKILVYLNNDQTQNPSRTLSHKKRVTVGPQFADWNHPKYFLTYLDLAGNSLSGTLPAALPVGLQSLFLGSNLLSGNIPMLPNGLHFISLDM